MSFSVMCKRIEVPLRQDCGGTFGFTLRGGTNPDPDKCRPLTVIQIRPKGPADRYAYNDIYIYIYISLFANWQIVIRRTEKYKYKLT